MWVKYGTEQKGTGKRIGKKRGLLLAKWLPPSQAGWLSDRCKSTLTVDSLITVTRSCGIDTRFPFNVPAAARWGKVTERTCCFLFSSSKSIAQPYTKRKKKRRNA